MHPSYLNTSEFLNMVLQTRGPQATPYAENVKFFVRDHLTELQKVFPTLAIKINDFHANDGQCQNLLKADGTIPIHYQGVKYNIPINIWLLERYPYAAPLVYVMPTPNMVIKSGHQYVDRNGQVTSPTLKNWQAPGSNLVDMTLELSHLFGMEPPLYSAPPGVARPPPPQPPPQPGFPQPQGYSQGSQGGQQFQPPPSFQPPRDAAVPYSQQYASDPSAGAGTMPWGAIFASAAYGAGAGAVSGRFESPTQGSHRDSNNGNSGLEAAAAAAVAAAGTESFTAGVAGSGGGASKAAMEESFRKVAIDALAMQLVAADKTFKAYSWQRTDELLEVQRTLTDKRGQLQSVVDTLKRELSSTEGVVQEMSAKSHQLRIWLERNEPKVAAAAAASASGVGTPADEVVGSSGAAEKPDIDALRAVQPVDDLTRQHLEAQAEDLAIEDTILALDSALGSSSAGLNLDNYIKQERSLARRQFFVRALALKTGDMLQQAQAAQPPSPPPGPGGPHANPPPPLPTQNYRW